MYVLLDAAGSLLHTIAKVFEGSRHQTWAERGEAMERPATSCDFCGNSQKLREYPTDHAGIEWFACPTCTNLIETEEWDRVIERSITAHAQLRPVRCGEEPILRKQVETLVESFRSFRLVAV